MTTNQEDEVNSLLPDRNLDKHIDTQAIRQGFINETIEQRELREKQARIARLKRSTIRNAHDEEQKTILKNELDRAKTQLNQQTSHGRRNGDIIVIKEGEAALTGTTRSDVLKLLQKLNINLNMQLTKTDTQNLLATLLTCNEKQLKALQANPKVPVVIKIVIKRLIFDMSTGDMASIDLIWDRIFGKTAMVIDTPSTPGLNGIIPNTPVSREAYLVIRDTYLGRQ